MKDTGAIRFCFMLVALLPIGCSKSTDPAAETLKEMEKQLLQIRAENTNLQARLADLDDKLLVYEKKDARNAAVDRKDALKTVHLRPQDERESAKAPVAPQEISMAAMDDASSADRPVLRLMEGESGSVRLDSVTTSARTASAGGPVLSLPMEGGDNLGVVKDGGVGELSAEDPMGLFHSAYRSYNNSDYAAALAGFPAFLQKESSHPYADDALFWIGECYLAEGRMMKAVGEFERLLRRYPNSEKGASALYRIGFAYEKLNDRERAQDYYMRVVERYPDTDAARRAGSRMSDNSGSSNLLRTSAKR